MHFEASYFGKKFKNWLYGICITEEKIRFLAWFCCFAIVQQDFIPDEMGISA